MNYIEAWYQGDPERGIKSLHPDLAKRIVRTHPESGQDTLENMSAATLAERWRSGQGQATPPRETNERSDGSGGPWPYGQCEIGGRGLD